MRYKCSQIKDRYAHETNLKVLNDVLKPQFLQFPLTQITQNGR